MSRLLRTTLRHAYIEVKEPVFRDRNEPRDLYAEGLANFTKRESFGL